jgi:peroxiredoxin
MVANISRLARCVAAVLTTVVTASTNCLAVNPGEQAPGFSVEMSDGTTIALSQLAGSVVYVDFWASWCGPCRHTLPWLSELHKKYGAQGFHVVPISVDTNPADGTQLIEELGFKLPSAFDSTGTIAAQYQLKSMPSGYLIGRDGKILEEIRGSSQDGMERIEKRLEAILGKRGKTSRSGDTAQRFLNFYNDIKEGRV